VTPDQWTLVERLYHEASSVPAPDRGAWLAQACGGDDVVRGEVESLLAQDASTPDALDDGALAQARGRGKNLSGRELGGYAFLELIDEGGMGQVYRARDVALPRDVAVKVIAPEFAADPVRRARFRREAGILAALSHPHIAHVYAFVEADGRSLLSMELVAGETLAATIRRGPLPGENVVRYGAEIADALAEAHAAGIVHRDLKPGNVMVTSRGVKVLDFGLARYDTATGSQTMTAVLGTPAYMAPEQALGHPTDARADLFSLGLVLYEMATGRLPVPGASLGSMLASDPSSSGIVSPSKLRSDLPAAIRGLDTLIATLLERDPAKRALSAADVASRLRSLGARHGPSRAAMVAAAGIALLAAAVWWAVRTPPPDAFTLQVAGLSPVSAAPGSKREPAFSPDGTAIAFVSRGASGNDPGIYMIPAPGVEPIRLTASPTDDVSPAWSPDGTRIAFLRIRPGRANELMVVRADPAASTAPTIVREVRQPEWFTRSTAPLLTWTPDGAILLPLDDPESGLTSLFRVDLNGGAPRRLIVSSGGLGASAPSFSRDGRWLVYSDSDASGRQLYLQQMDGDAPRGERQRVPDSLSGQTPALSPDGSRLIWVAGPRLMQWDRAGAAAPIYVLPNDSFNALTASWADGNLPRVVFSNEGARVELLQLALKDGGRRADGTPAPFVKLAARQANPALSPNGRWLAFETVGFSGRAEIWMASADGSNPQPLTTAVDPGAAMTWSQDSRHLTFHARPPQLAQAFVLDIDENGGAAKPRQVTNSGFELFGPVFSADGKHLYMTSSRVPSAMRVVRIGVEGGELEDLFEGDSARISADGHRILYAKAGQRGIWERSLDGDIRSNPETRIIEDYIPPAGYLPAKAGVVYTGRDTAGKVTALRFFDYALRRSFDLAPTARMQAGSVPVLTLSPDEQRLVYYTYIPSDSQLTSIEFKR